ncbi:MAG: hypothetical protein ACP5N3_05155 [Candidatus Nanoarchaeia archaeon]
MIKIRKFRRGDEKRVSAIIRKCLREVNSRDYPKRVIDFMVDYFSPENVLKLSKEKYVVVAVDGERIVGTGSLYKKSFAQYLLTLLCRGRE